MYATLRHDGAVKYAVGFKPVTKLSLDPTTSGETQLPAPHTSHALLAHLLVSRLPHLVIAFVSMHGCLLIAFVGALSRPLIAIVGGLSGSHATLVGTIFVFRLRACFSLNSQSRGFRAPFDAPGNVLIANFTLDPFHTHS
ncbi:hypothetical protein DFH07DRAFT_964253 [Mycena maculata]|uniref:Uncharacterized protein n=1 Tax=Mycena maculata TaxID=230809 RepID=A0AAD7IH46_9AGAR|nr:hypothetical protein DFH07DRAFT_964253 [Mycena maculata]